MIEFRLLGYHRDKSLGLLWPESDQERGRGDEEIGLADSMIPAMGESREEVFQNVANQFLEIKRFGRVEEVAALVAFLASEKASFITGSASDVDGGLTRSLR